MPKVREHEAALDVCLRETQAMAKPPHLTRYSKADTWRTQTVDYCADALTPYIADAGVPRITTKNDADSHLAEARANLQATYSYTLRAAELADALRRSPWRRPAWVPDAPSPARHAL